MRIAPLALTAWLLASCSSPEIQVSPEAAMQFKIGQSTEAQILAKLGKPTSTDMAGDTKFLTYGNVRHLAKGATSMALYQIDEKGVLEDVTYTDSDGDARSGVRPEQSKPQTLTY